MPDGVVLLDNNGTQFFGAMAVCAMDGPLRHRRANFYDVMGTPEILGPDFCPFIPPSPRGARAFRPCDVSEPDMRVHAARHRCRRTSESGSDHSRSDGRGFAAAKLSAIHQAGIGWPIDPRRSFQDVGRGELDRALRANILRYAGCFAVQRRRNPVLDPKTKILEPVLAVGMTEQAASRVLRADTAGNGVTGFVAATGKGYLCEDTCEDPLYLEGCAGNRSSLTVPVMLHDRVTARSTSKARSREP
jgi:hypothetical protein